MDIFNKFKSGEISYSEAKIQLIDLWKGVQKLDRKSIEKLFGQIELRPGALEGIKYLQGKYRLCLISGAIDVFVDVIANKLGITDRYASTKFLFDKNNILFDFQYTLSRGEEKVELFHSFCKKYSIDPQECAAIGDGESDMPIFSEVALPILFIASETEEDNKKKIRQHLKDWKSIKKIL